MASTTPTQAISQRLRAVAGVSALVSSRVYPVIPKQDVTWPYLVVRIASGGGGTHLGARNITQNFAMAVGVFAQSETDAAAVMKQVVIALHGWRDLTESVERVTALDDRTAEELEDGSIVTEQTFSLWFRES
jgi:hypothetical protein